MANHIYREPFDDYTFYISSCYDCGTDVVLVASQHDEGKETFCPRCKGNSLVGGRYYKFEYPISEFHIKNPRGV